MISIFLFVLSMVSLTVATVTIGIQGITYFIIFSLSFGYVDVNRQDFLRNKYKDYIDFMREYKDFILSLFLYNYVFRSKNI